MGAGNRVWYSLTFYAHATFTTREMTNHENQHYFKCHNSSVGWGQPTAVATVVNLLCCAWKFQKRCHYSSIQ